MRPSLLAIAIGLVLTGCTVEDSSTSAPNESGEQATAEETPEPVTPNPEADAELTCDYVLGDFGESGDPSQGFRFIGGGTVTNTGNIGVKVRVTFTFKQLGSPSIRKTKTIRVRRNGSREVNVSLPATQDQIDLHQSAANTGEACRSKGTIIDTYGTARD